MFNVAIAGYVNIGRTVMETVDLAKLAIMTPDGSDGRIFIGGDSTMLIMIMVQMVNILLLAAGVFALVLLVKVLLKANKALDIWLSQNVGGNE